MRYMKTLLNLSGTVPWHNRRFRIVAAMTFCAVMIIIVAFMRITSRSALMPEPVRRGEFAVDCTESGEIQAVNAVYVKAPHEWRIDLQIIGLAPEGSFVKEGDFLLQFDPSPLEQELSQAEDLLKQAQAELLSIDSQQSTRESEQTINLKIADMSKEAAQISVEQLKYESRIRQEDARLDLEKELIRHEEAVDKRETQKIIDYAERRKTLTRVEEAQNNLGHINDRIGRFTLTAPISGMVIYEEIGGWAAPRHKVFIGDKVPSGRAAISIPDLSRMKMVIQINEIDISLFSTGEKAGIILNAFPDREYHGVVTDISPIVTTSDQRERFPKPPSFSVNIAIDESDSLLKPGMSAQAKITLEHFTDVLSVPVGAVFEHTDGSTVVFTRRSYPDPVPIRLGKRNDRFIIVEDGLSESDEVVLIPPSTGVHPLGWHVEMKRRETERENYLNHLDIMKERGMTGETDAADSTAAPETAPEAAPDQQ